MNEEMKMTVNSALPKDCSDKELLILHAILFEIVEKPSLAYKYLSSYRGELDKRGYKGHMFIKEMGRQLNYRNRRDL